MNIPVDSRVGSHALTSAPSLNEPEVEQQHFVGSQPRTNNSAERGASEQSQNVLGWWAKSATPVPLASPDSHVNQQEVDSALRICRADTGNDSALAEVLRNPNLNEAERNLIVQKLAREEGQQSRFYANDAHRTVQGDSAALTADQRTIADAVQNAYQDGAINTNDLLRIADNNQAGNGAQRFMSILSRSDAARERGGTVEALADALWTRNDHGGTDRAVAAMHYTSDPALMASKLDTPDKRAAAFESLVSFNESDPYKNMQSSQAPLWRTDALAATGRLFVAHSQELIDRYTIGSEHRAPQTGTLANFFSQTLFNPHAQGIVLDRTRDLVPTVRAALQDAGAAPVAPPTQWTREDRTEVDALITTALHRNGNDIEKAFAELRDRRQKPENYYDTNLAIAADYLRARWETQKSGPNVAASQVETYLLLKRTTGVPQEGPGPVSPYSDLQAEYMRKGVADEAQAMSLLERMWWDSPVGSLVGLGRAAFGVFEGEEG